MPEPMSHQMSSEKALTLLWQKRIYSVDLPLLSIYLLQKVKFKRYLQRVQQIGLKTEIQSPKVQIHLHSFW